MQGILNPATLEIAGLILNVNRVLSMGFYLFASFFKQKSAQKPLTVLNSVHVGFELDIHLSTHL